MDKGRQIRTRNESRRHEDSVEIIPTTTEIRTTLDSSVVSLSMPQEIPQELKAGVFSQANSNIAQTITTSTFQRPITSAQTNTAPSMNDLSERASPLAKAAATQIKMTADLMDQVESLTHLTSRLADDSSICNFKIDSRDITNNIPNCTGDDPVKLVEFVQEVQAVVDLRLAPERTLLKSLLSRVHDDLRSWWASAVLEFRNWNELKTALILNFISPVTKQQLTNTLVRRPQRSEESFKNFIRDILAKASALNANMNDSELILQICANANYSTLLELKGKSLPITIEDLKSLSREIEETQALLQAAKSREESASTSNLQNKSNFKPFKNSKN